MRPEDRYYPSYYADSLPREKLPHGRANIDPYATLTPSERIRGVETSKQSYKSTKPKQDLTVVMCWCWLHA